MEKISNTKKNIFNLFFILFIVVIFILLEVFLRIINFGINTEPFVKSNNIGNYIDNVYFVNKYYPYTKNIITSEGKNFFTEKKEKDTLRGFVVGGSTAQGFPYFTNQSFSKITEISLKKAGKNVEIINLGFSAMSSYYVADVSKKILKYEPDFLVIYSGHNEYYGTISKTTGGNYFTKKMYLFLKEFKLTQLILGFFVKNKTYEKSLMQHQFANRKIVKNDKFDSEIATDFIKNIESVVNLYNKKNIPVIIIEPISNLNDMPPFGGENDDLFKDFIKEYANVLKSNNLEEIKAFYQKRLANKDYDKNANIYFLDIFTKVLLKENVDIKEVMETKDLDTIPFRARNILVEKLRNFGTSNKYKNLHYLNLFDALFKEYGINIFSQNIFIDHLHFNMNGQMLVAKNLSKEIAKVFNIQNISPIDEYFATKETVYQSIYFLDLYKTYIDLRISDLVSAPPYSEMILPFKKPTFEDSEILKIESITKSSYENFNELFNVLLDYYMKNSNYDMLSQYLLAYSFINPADYHGFLNLGRFYKMIDKNQICFNYYLVSYLLSDRNYDIYNEIIEFLKSQQKDDIIKDFTKKYGKPKKRGNK